MSEYINVPKTSCPRDRGLFQCPRCRRRTLQKAGTSDYPVTPVYCERIVGGKICGKTHMGYTWCDECRQAGRDKRNQHVSHASQYEVVARYRPPDISEM